MLLKTCLVEILQTKDRVPALVVGKSLATQGLFHHVNYEYKLCDDDTFYQFHMENENWPYDDLPLLPKKANRRLGRTAIYECNQTVNVIF